jgi:hypothetical protein
MAAPILPDALWERVEWLPTPKPRRFLYLGRLPLTNQETAAPLFPGGDFRGQNVAG